MELVTPTKAVKSRNGYRIPTNKQRRGSL